MAARTQVTRVVRLLHDASALVSGDRVSRLSRWLAARVIVTAMDGYTLGRVQREIVAQAAGLH